MDYLEFYGERLPASFQGEKKKSGFISFKNLTRAAAMGLAYTRKNPLLNSALIGLFIPTPYLMYVGFQYYLKKNPNLLK